MSQTHFRSRTFWGLFSSYIFLLIVLIFISLYHSSQTRLIELTEETRKGNETAVAEISSFLDSHITELTSLAYKLNRTAWVQKLYSDIPSFNEKFTYERRNEIADGFSLYVGINTVVDKVLLFLPYREICISAELWTDTDTFFSLMGLDSEQQNELVEWFCATQQVRQLTFEESRLFPDMILLCAPVESIERPRAYICYFISKVKLGEALRKQMPFNLVRFGLWNDDDGSEWIHVTQNETGADISLLTRQAAYLNWRYEFGFQNNLIVVHIIDDLRQGFRNCGWMFALGLVISYLLSLLSYRPVGMLLRKAARLVAKETGMRRKSDYGLISESMDRLADENDEMRAYTGEYEKIMRVNVIRRLLQGYFNLDEARQQLERYRVPFNNSDYYQVYLIVKDEGKTTRQITPEIVGQLMCLEALLESMPGERYAICDTLDGHMVLITAYTHEKEAMQRSGRIVETILNDQFLRNGSTVFPGSVQRGYVGVSLSYQHAQDKCRHYPDRSTLACYYPLEWEAQLIAGLKAGNAQTVLFIIDEIRCENERRYGSESKADSSAFKIIAMLVDTIYRVLDELNLDDSAYGDEFEMIFTGSSLDAGWSSISRICTRICQETGQSDSAGTSALEANLKEYVLTHYTDQNLSLKMLEDQFKTSMQTISHLFKNRIGDTFHSFLSKVRIEKAKELLRTTDGTMSSVARQVGYSNEFSFKRAFIRYTGVRPKDYANNNRTDQTPLDA